MDVQVTYDDLERTKALLNRVSESMNQTIDQLKGVIDDLMQNGFNTQLASKKYHDSFNEWNAGMKQAMEALPAMAQKLQSVIVSYEEADNAGGPF